MEKVCSSGISISIMSPPRSGSHLLATKLAEELNFSVIYEAPYIWKRVASYSGDDEITEYTQVEVDLIRGFFFNLSLKYMSKYRTSGLIEKCPSNIMRPEFYFKVFNDVNIVCLYRNPEEVYISLLKKAYGNLNKISGRPQKLFSPFHVMNERICNHLFNGIRLSDILRDYRHYFNVLMNLFGVSKIYGPKEHGYQDLFLDLGVEEYYRYMALRYCGNLISFYEENKYKNNVYFIHYNDLVASNDNFCLLVEKLKQSVYA